ncbi:MAG TPA: sugar transferase [Candidatus Eisenbacteria bacterium]|nr:sugar transferase [Candidatus Eisenbacteria bacterium]
MILPSEYLGPKTTVPAGERRDAAIKRGIDVVLASLGLILLLPVFGLIALAIKLDSRGPILYSQERVGLNRRRRLDGNGAPAIGNGNGHSNVAGNGHANGHSNGNGNGNGATSAVAFTNSERRNRNCYGRPFKIYKFRSMVTDAERNTGPVWAAKSDSRITRVGHILRKTRLDETPQLWNVLLGDMSLVGPRPERPTFVLELAQTLPDYPQRCNTLPGITGLAQVKWQYDTSIETVNRKLEYDLYYVRHRRLLLDLKIMAATVKVMARGDGAH